MSTPEAALAAGTEWLRAQDAPEAAIVALEVDEGAGGTDAGDASDEARDEARRWVRRILDGEEDGAWDDDLLATVRALLTLRELRDAVGLREQDPGVGRALDWVKARRRRPGAWTGGCDPDRHRQGFCHHFAAGFHSTRSVAEPADLPSGARLDGEMEARFAISAAALRCTMEWRVPSTDDRLQLEALRRVVAGWDERPTGLSHTALLAAVHALLHSERDADREAAVAGLEIAAGRQRGDGSWIDADPFHAIAVFDAARAAGVGGDRVVAALDHATRLLATAQRSDGSWGPDHGPRRALIGVRALRARLTP